MWWPRKPTTTVDEVPHQFFETPGVGGYWDKDRLNPAEKVVLHDLYNESKNEPILEIGVGAGRITSYLLNVTDQYVGIDYSANMIDSCKHRFPDADLRLCDARSMPCFGSNCFSVVMLWGNVIDDVRPAERSVILREANRILKANGILLLSSHNLDWNEIARGASGFEGLRPWSDLDFLSIAVYGRCLLKQFWTRMSQKDYAVFSEYFHFQGNRMVVPTCYIRKEAQEKQLLRTGFAEISAMTMDGEQFTEAGRSRGFMIYYTARKR
jgi:ubiquinone/menaquinone biosynthesis C-methylase UbiE